MKILVIRFSSMGDIIYTTPVVRCIKKQVPGAEVHFLTKPAYQYIYDNNPYVDKLLLLQDSLSLTVKQIKAERYDYIIDLHSNLRTAIIKLRTGIKSSTFNKQRLSKWLSLKFKLKLVKPVHLVDRYLKTVEFIGVKNDGAPIDYYIKQQHSLTQLLPSSHQKFVAFIIGAAHFTKRMPNNQVIEICNNINLPIVLLGGADVKENSLVIANAVGPKIYNACGVTSLDESVYIVSQAQSIVGFDTGLTHIAEAFNKPIASVWGSTVPELLGVQPYMVKQSLVAGVELPCRPCSKFGRSNCPLGHFKCMKDIDGQTIAAFVNN